MVKSRKFGTVNNNNNNKAEWRVIFVNFGDAIEDEY